MKLKDYLKDKTIPIVFRVFWISGIWVIMSIFEFSLFLRMIFIISYILVEMTILLWDFLRRKKFYDEIFMNLERLDKKYLILETIETPSFYDGEMMCEILYDVDKSMCENVNRFKKSMTEFKEYIELWVHEVKLPLSSLRLMCHNNKREIDRKYVEQIRRIDTYTEQVLYYARSEHTEKDYLIKEVELDKLIGKVALNQKDDLLEQQIAFGMDCKNTTVLTDGKWLEFILNQIINNAVKYRDDRKESCISCTVEDLTDKTVLHVKDNGIGIPSSDLSRVFEKSFTGENGRFHAKATGMGLYIARKLCDNLGHTISIESEQGEYTLVSISFAKNNFYKM